MSFVGRTVLITGAGGGIGKTTAQAFAKSGASVAINDIDRSKAENTVEEIKREGGEAIPAFADITSKQDVLNMVSQVEKNLGDIDILVNNAGIFSPKSFFELDESTWDKTFSVNLKGIFLCTQRVSESMVKRKQGRIINLASVAALVPFPHYIHYCASKAGVIQFTRVLAMILAPHGITVNAVAPGSTETAMLERMVRGKPERLKSIIQGKAEEFLPGIPLGRVATPQDQSSMILFLASVEAAHITGQTIYVDGGQSL